MQKEVRYKRNNLFAEGRRIKRPGLSSLASFAALACLLIPATVFGGESSRWTSLPDEVAVHENGLLTVGYAMIGSESDWRIACNASVLSAFTRENGYSLLVSDAQQKPEKQIKALREFISQEVDYILLDPVVESGWDVSLEEAKEAGIPVIVFDREVETEETDVIACSLGSDFKLEGLRAVAFLKAYLESISYTEPLNIVHIQGTLESSAQRGRTEALDEALSAHSDWTLLDRQSGAFTTSKGKEVMVDMLEKYGGQIQVVYCENDNEAYGAIQAIEEAGFRAGTDLAAGDILVLSFDATEEGLTYTLNGKILVNTECAPLYGPMLSQVIALLEEGEGPLSKQFVREEQFTALEEPAEVTVQGETYPATVVTGEMIKARDY